MKSNINKTTKGVLKINALGFVLCTLYFVLSSCNNVPNSPGWEYMPDMYRSSSYETNSANPNFADSLTNRQPVTGTISQGWIANSEFSSLKVPYPYKNDSAGYEDAGKNLKDPFPASPEIIAQGKDRFDKYCSHCHGASGQGDGSVVAIGNFPPPPAYNSPQLKNLPEGKMFHTIQYGKGMMGSHASQLTVEERWKIIRYVQTLQNPGGVAAVPAPAADSIQKVSVPQVKKTTNDTIAKK
jgi:mono/diheme cytochrome c family protein